MKLKSATILAAVCSNFAFAHSLWSAELSYVDLVNRLTDLEQLAVLPEPGEKTAQWSSYDRQSKYDEASGKYIAWDANGDGDGIIRKEGDKLVLAEMEGPGCIWRIWSADAKAGRVQIYLDGATAPSVDLQFSEYFNRKHAPFTRPALVHNVARGFNNYTPIPYQKSCKIVAEPGWGLYYQFVYQTFAPGTKVPTFRTKLSQEESAALDRANDILQRGGIDLSKDAPDQEVTRASATIEPGKTLKLPTLKGSRAITGIRARLNLPPGAADRDALRELAIQINWDGETKPSVWAPFGDFFGSPSANTYRSLPLGRTGSEWWYSRWYMPFADQAQVTLANDGATPKEVVLEVYHAPVKRPISELGRFHAKWHRDAFLPAEQERAIDWTMLKTEGRGRFVGVMLHIWNPRGGWWGEGDEKFHIDGEKFPSTFGTGSEDYFGYAWCDPGLFENAFHNQTHNDGNNKGHVVVNRWHIGDNIPFHQGIEAFIEKYYPNKKPTLYASTAYWYLDAKGKDPYTPQPLEERIGYWIPVEARKVAGAIEGEKLRILSSTAGNPHEQDLSGFEGEWSNEAHLWWINATPGAKLELALPVEKDGTYKLFAQLTKARDYAIVQLYLDGNKLGGPVDLFNQAVVPTGLLSLGTHALTAGQHRLGVEILGANELAVKSYMFGLDYLKLDPAQ